MSSYPLAAGPFSRLFPAVIFLDWSQYGAPGWTEACPGVDLRWWSSWSSKPYTQLGGRK